MASHKALVSLQNSPLAIPEKFASIIVFSGGLLGKNINLPVGNLEGTQVFFGCSDNDPHIPLSRVKESIRAFKDAGAVVTECLYPGRTHTITDKELDIVRRLILG